MKILAEVTSSSNRVARRLCEFFIASILLPLMFGAILCFKIVRNFRFKLGKNSVLYVGELDACFYLSVTLFGNNFVDS